jgi:hypothetical protein
MLNILDRLSHNYRTVLLPDGVILGKNCHMLGVTVHRFWIGNQNYWTYSSQLHSLLFTVACAKSTSPLVTAFSGRHSLPQGFRTVLMLLPQQFLANSFTATFQEHSF